LETTAPLPQPKALTRMQLNEFLIASIGEPYEPLIRFLAWTGCRLGEALALRWPDVDLERRIVVIRRSVRVARESEPKARFGLRSIDMPKKLIGYLEKLPSRDANDLVFPAQGGGYLNARHVHPVFVRVSKRAGLPPVHPHMLRHTWATLMINQGVPIVYVSRALGHHSTAFTSDIYMTTQPNPRHDDVDRFADLSILNEPTEKLEPDGD